MKPLQYVTTHQKLQKKSIVLLYILMLLAVIVLLKYYAGNIKTHKEPHYSVQFSGQIQSCCDLGKSNYCFNYHLSLQTWPVVFGPQNTCLLGLKRELGEATDKAIESLKRAISECIYLFNSLMALVNIWSGQKLAILLKFRQQSEKSFRHYLPGLEGKLLFSMVFGQQEPLAEPVKHAFKVIGMQHVTAASGFNVGLIAVLAQQLTSRFWGRRVRGLFAIACIFWYVLMAGSSASVVRAGCMLGLSLFISQCCFRQVSTLRILMFTIVCMLVVNRQYLQDIGWQLSVASTLGLLLVTPLLSNHSTRNEIEMMGNVEENPTRFGLGHWVSETIKDSTLTTLAAQSFSFPLLVHHFGEVSLLSLPANALLLWMTPWLTISGIWLWLLAQVSVALHGLGHIWLLMAGMWLGRAMNIFIDAVLWMGQWDSTLLKVKPWSWPQVFLWWLMIFFLVIKFSSKGKKV